MKVKIFSLIVPVVLVLALIVGAVYILQQQQVENAANGYQYKEKLFQEQEVGLIDIEVAEEDWQSILDDPTAEEYVSATVTVNGETYENVGIRAKGNSSLSSVASSESDRYSLKVDFGQYNDSQTFYGLEKLNLNNNFSDSTQMKEFVAYEMLEQMDISVPAHSYVKVMLNGNYYGLMLAVEEIGAAFAQTNFGSTNGFLFKPEDEGSDLVYVSDDPDDYSGIFNNVKLNEETAEARSNILTMIKEINEGSTASLDVEQVAKYFAINTALVNLDSYQGSFHHNYYLYENADGVFSIVPWDYNMSFGGFNMGGGGRERPATDASDENEQSTQSAGNEQRQHPGGGLMQGGDMMTDSNINFSITEPVSGTTVDAIPLLKVILEDEQGRAYYEQYLEQFATDVFTEKNIATITTSLKDLLYDAVNTDPSKFFTNEEFLAGAEGEESLSAFAKVRSNSILQQLAGEIEGISGSGSGRMPNLGDMDIPDNLTPPTNGEMPEGMPENFTPPTNGEMPEGMSENFTPPANGEMPEEMPTSPPTGEVPDNFTEPNGKQSQLPKDTEGATNSSQQQDGISVAEGELADTQRQNGMRRNMANPFGTEAEEDPAVTMNTLYTVAASLLALVLAMFIINIIVSNRKYKRKKG